MYVIVKMSNYCTIQNIDLPQAKISAFLDSLPDHDCLVLKEIHIPPDIHDATIAVTDPT